MSVKVTDVRYYTDLTNSQSLSYLQGNINDDITIEVDFYFENVNFCTDKNKCVLVPPFTSSVDVAKVIQFNNPTFVNDLRVGDKIALSFPSQYSGTFFNGIVTEKIDGKNVRFDFYYYGTTTPLPGIVNATESVGTAINETQLSGIRYFYNFVNSGTSFKSLIDETEIQRLIFKSLLSTTTSYADMIFEGGKTYQIGSAKVKGRGFTTGKHLYTIQHKTKILPTFLKNQYSDLKNNIKPSYFKNGKGLNYISKFEMSKNINDIASVVGGVVPTNASNIGWYNENFNGGAVNYYINSLVYDNTINTLDFSAYTKITTILKCKDASFTTNSRIKFSLQFLPDDATFYQQNGNDLSTNFQNDDLVVQANNSAVNGAFFGTTNQKIKTVKATVTDTSTITIETYVELGANSKVYFGKGSEKRFLTSITAEKYNDYTDRVNLILDVNQFAVQLAETNIVNFDTVFIQHPYNTRSFGILNTDFDIMPVDDVVCNTSLSINFTDLQNDGIRILNVKPTIKLKHATESDIILDSFSINTTNTDIVNYDYTTGGKLSIQNVAFSQGRPFKIPDEIRRNIVLTRDFDNDNSATNLYSFALNFPFMMRWEYWNQLILSNIDSDFFDNAEEFNGINNNWTRLASITGWDFVYSVTVELIRLGVTYTQTEDYVINTVGLLANSDYSNNSIKSYDITTDALINSGSVWYLKGYENTKIVATFNKTGATIDPCIVLWIETFESGGQSDIRRISSEHDNDAQSLFVDNKVVITNPSSGVYKGTAYIDSTKLPQNTKYTLYARIYDMNVVEDTFRITNDLIIRSTMFGEKRQIL